MAQYNGNLLPRFLLLATMIFLPCEGFYSYKGVRYSYGCTGWLYMGMVIKWKVGEYLLAPFIALNFACESDACAEKQGMCKPDLCGPPCDYFCDKEHVYYALHILNDGNEQPTTDAECISDMCVDEKYGVANIVCNNYKLLPDGKKKYTLHLTIDVTQEGDDLPSRNKDADLYIVAGNVNISECTGAWKDGINTMQAGDVGNFVVTLMDSYGNKVNEATGRIGDDLIADFRPTVSAGASGDKDSVTDVKALRRGDTGLYDITFLTSRIGDFNLNVFAFTSATDFFLIKGSPFPFSVTAGSLYVPACTGSWIVGGPIDPGGTVTLRAVLKDKANELMPGANYTFKAEVARAIGTRTFTLPFINSSATVGIPGSIDFVVRMQTAGDFVLKISSQAGDEQIEGSPFPFTVKAGPFFLPSTKGSWPGGVNTLPAGVESSLRVLAVDKEGNIINPLPAGVLICTVEKLATDNRTLPDTPVTVKPEAPDTGYQLLGFVPKMTGKFDLKVTGSDGTSIPGSPFVFTVIPGFPSPLKSMGAWFNSIDKFAVGDRAEFVITLVDAYGNNITTASRGGSRLASFNWITSVINQDNPLVAVPYTVTVGAPTDAGTQSLTFTPTASGSFVLNIGTSAEVLQGSPFPFKVRAGNPFMAGCTASWIDATANPPKFNAGSRPKMEVTQKDGNKNLYLDVFPFTLKVIPAPSTASAPVPSLSLSSPAKDLITEEGPNLAQGKVIVTFTAIASGEFKFHVGDGKTEISGSPFTFIVDAGPLSLSTITGGWSSSKSLFSLGERVTFLITQRDTYGNPAQQDINNPAAGTAYFSARLFTAGENHYELQGSDLTILPLGSPTFIQEKLQFTTSQVGNFELEVYVSTNKPSLANDWFYWEEDSSIQIVGSPFRFSVGGDIYVPVCNASGTGLIGGAAGDTLQFTIFTYTKTLVASPAPASSFKVEFNPDVSANVQLTEGSGNTINVQYRITAASGPSGYAMTVKAATTSSEIRGSPFVVKISAGPFVIDYCYGHFKGGNPAVPVRKLATFIIYQMDAFGNKLYTDSSGVHDFTIKVFTDNQNSVTLDIKITPSVSYKDQMLVTFTITDVGKYSLEVGDTTGSIRGSPFGFSAVEGVVITADDCTTQFVPGQDLKVGVHLDIIITTKDDAGHTKKSGNILEFAVTSVPPMTGTPDPVAPLDMDNGTYVATIRITSAGFVSFLITLFDEAIPGSPFEFEVEGGDSLPRAEFDDVWTWMNYPLTFNVLSNDYVKSGSPIFIKIDAPENGGMVVGLDGTMVYTPDADYTGNEYLTYEMKDDAGEIAFGEVSVTVSPPGQPYISAFPRSLYAFEDQPLPATG
ncbi:hypothetical protein Mapa_008562 [Marchantia paleacea]|nr:hypothetical protein Mapa_008562 [Marchantia paleacea]